jgi:hypothetical protein
MILRATFDSSVICKEEEFQVDLFLIYFKGFRDFYVWGVWL